MLFVMDGALFYKESTFGFWILFWLHQGRIPRHTCRFHLFLAGAVGKRQGISIPYPSPTPLLTPLGIRCGGAYLLPRAWGNIGSCIPVLSLLPSSEFYLAVCVRAGIVRVSVGLLGFGRTFFIIGGEGLFVPAATWGLATDNCWICADRDWGVSLGG